jgi:hypothetical protein
MKTFKLTWPNGQTRIIESETIREMIRNFDLATRENILVKIEEIEN